MHIAAKFKESGGECGSGKCELPRRSASPGAEKNAPGAVPASGEDTVFE
jgi:hypothetical protein